MGNPISRLLAAVPDATTSVIFLTAWIAPTVLGPEWVRNLMLTMLIEFIVMHSSIFYATLVMQPNVARSKRAGVLIGLSAFYMIFIAGFSLAFHSAWPLFAFGWLFITRFITLWTHPVPSAKTMTMMSTWVASVVFYIGGVFATLLLPLPSLGLTREFVASMHLSGSGEWIDHPHIVIAFGMLYFGAQAWFKFYLTGKASAVNDNATARGVDAN